MNSKKWLGAIGVALVAALALGGAATAFAATAEDAPAAAATGACGYGLRMGAAVRDAGGRLADVVAELTGTSVEDVQAARQDGASFAEIAEASGVAADDVVAEALAVRKALLDAKVADGTITQEQADAILAQIEDRLTERVESTAPGCTGAGMGGGMGGRGAGRGAGMGGCGMGACQGTVAD
jgi:hypothetical protein